MKNITITYNNLDEDDFDPRATTDCFLSGQVNNTSDFGDFTPTLAAKTCNAEEFADEFADFSSAFANDPDNQITDINLDLISTNTLSPTPSNGNGSGIYFCKLIYFCLKFNLIFF